jgi:hypothetical protein
MAHITAAPRGGCRIHPDETWDQVRDDWLAFNGRGTYRRT